MLANWAYPFFQENYRPLESVPALKEADFVDHVLSCVPRSIESPVLCSQDQECKPRLVEHFLQALCRRYTGCRFTVEFMEVQFKTIGRKIPEISPNT